MLYRFVLLVAAITLACNRKVADRTAYFPRHTELADVNEKKENVWVFIMAGQSNMAGRGLVEPGDTIPSKRIMAINKNGELVIAKEPLHGYEPERTGLDCGYSFANTLLPKLPPNVSVLMVPVAIGGSSISQWLGDSLYRNVKLFSNFKEKTGIAKKYGTVKAILWHQGESDANEKDIPLYRERLGMLFSKFRKETGNGNLPVILGELGSFSGNPEKFNRVNRAIHDYVAGDANSRVISTRDLKHKGDHLHFDSKAQRLMGKRYAEAYLSMPNQIN